MDDILHEHIRRRHRVRRILLWIALTAAALVAAAAVIALAANRRFHGSIDVSVKRLFADQCIERPRANRADLPAPVSNYLDRVGAFKHPGIARSNMTQRGRIRGSEEASFVPFVAEQHVSLNPPGFVWRSTSYGVVHAVDQYVRGEGSLRVSLLGLVTLAQMRGDEARQGELLRYFGEMPLYPTAFMGDNVEWTSAGNASAVGVLRDGDLSVRAEFEFGPGQLLRTVRAERYRDTGELCAWSGRFDDYRSVAGVLVPFKMSATWHLDTGDFEYVQIEIRSIEFEPRIEPDR